MTDRQITTALLVAVLVGLVLLVLTAAPTDRGIPEERTTTKEDTTTMTTTHVTLSKDALERVLEADDPLTQTWREIAAHFGHDSIDAWCATLEGGRLRVGDVAIPRAQTEAICQALLERESNPALERVNTMLDWLNVGPATFEPEAVTS